MNWWRKEAEKGLDDRIKQKIRSSPFFVGLFEQYGIPLDQVDRLHFEIKRLEKSFAEANGDTIVIDDRVAHQPDFLTSGFHFVAHEIVHWLKRQLEKNNYFADPEEVEGFNTGIAYALFNGSSDSEVLHQFYPLVKVVIHDGAKALQFLKGRIEAARNLLSDMGLCNCSS